MTPTHVILKYNGQNISDGCTRERFVSEWIHLCGFVEGKVYAVKDFEWNCPVVFSEKMGNNRYLRSHWIDASMPHLVEE